MYVDSNILLYAILKDPERASRCRNLLQAIMSSKLEAWTSLLTVCEVHNVICRRFGQEKAVRAAEAVMSMPFHFVPLDFGVLCEALHQSSECELRTFDAVHAASALSQGITTIYSYDVDFDKTSLRRLEP